MGWLSWLTGRKEAPATKPPKPLRQEPRRKGAVPAAAPAPAPSRRGEIELPAKAAAVRGYLRQRILADDEFAKRTAEALRIWLKEGR